jgi:hypothetical protein
MQKCRWLKPRLITTIDYLWGTATNQLRHSIREVVPAES